MTHSVGNHSPATGGGPLAEPEIAVLRSALAEFGLAGEDGKHWDSLDVLTAVSVARFALGIALDGNQLDPRLIRDLPGLVAAIKSSGRRTSDVTLRVSLPEGESTGLAGRQRERRRQEYRLGAAFPQAQLGLSRGSALVLLGTAATLAELPLAPAALAALHASPGHGGGTTGADQVGGKGCEAAAAIDRGADAGHLVDRLEQEIRGFVVARGGLSLAPAGPVVAIEVLRRLGYYDAHPEQIIHLGTESALLPAVCLGVYPLLDGDHQTLATTFGYAFRREHGYDPALGRLPCFGMREILWCAPKAEAAAITESVAGFVGRLAATLGINASWTDAADPFFLADGTAGQKRELRAPVAGTTISIASVNQHGEHFTGRGYGRAGWVTGCAGLGYERWTVAVQYAGGSARPALGDRR